MCLPFPCLLLHRYSTFISFSSFRLVPGSLVQVTFMYGFVIWPGSTLSELKKKKLKWAKIKSGVWWLTFVIDWCFQIKRVRLYNLQLGQWWTNPGISQINVILTIITLLGLVALSFKTAFSYLGCLHLQLRCYHHSLAWKIFFTQNLKFAVCTSSCQVCKCDLQMII